MTTLTLTREQRDALVYGADDYRDCEEVESEWWWPRWDAIESRLIDDLLLPDAAGHYEIRSLSRRELSEFLEHSIKFSLESAGVEGFLRVWHTSVVLLEQLGHQVDGSIYAINCSCEPCSWVRLCEARCDAEVAALGDVAPDAPELAAIGRRYLRVAAGGPRELDERPASEEA